MKFCGCKFKQNSGSVEKHVSKQLNQTTSWQEIVTKKSKDFRK